MIDIIVYSKDNKLTVKIKNIIKQKYVKINIISFSNLTLDLQHLIISKRKVIYILYIDNNDSEVIKIAEQIRIHDFESIIIFIISYELSAVCLSKKKIMFLALISIYDNFERELHNSLNIAIHILENKNIFTLSNSKEIYFINKDEILYISSLNKKTYIHLVNKTIETTLSLKNLTSILECNLVQTHKSCYINLDNTYKIDLVENKIIFKNSHEISLLSRRYKKELKEKFNSYMNSK